MDRDLKEQYELQSLFDLSKVLNSSLNLKTILDTLLLTPMGKFLIGKGVVFLADEQHCFTIETLKGLPKSLIGKRLKIDDFPTKPTFVADAPRSPWQVLLEQNGIQLVIPILHDGSILGLIGFGPKSIGGEYTDSDLNYLYSLSNIAATAVQNGIIFQELHEANRKLEKKIQELNTLSEIDRELNSTLSSLDSKKVVNLLAYSIMGELMVNRCLIWLAVDGKMVLSLNKGFQDEEVDKIVSDASIVDHFSSIDTPVIVSGAKDDVCAKLREAGIAVLVPMRIETETKGMVALGEKITKLPFVQEDIDFLTILGNWSSMSIETARLIEEEVEKKKLEEELRIASEIQKQLLPETCPKIDGFEIAATNEPSLQIGGDYYDCIKLNEDEYILCIADVSGKGAPAALLMANVQASLHALVGIGLTIARVTERINEIIYRNTTYDKFITFFIGLLNVRERKLYSVNAGHNPPYIFHKDRSFQTLNEGGLIVGVMPGVQYSSESTELKSGDCIVMFTDGVSEAMNAKDEEFEEHRIEACIARNYDLPAQDLLEALIGEVKAFSAGCPQADDITALIIKVR